MLIHSLGGRLGAALLTIAVAAVALLALPGAARAQSPGLPTAIAVAAPSSAQLGQAVTVKAKLVDGAGNVFPNARVDFTSPETFLNNTGDMVVASALTDDQGVATAQFQARRSGPLTVKAVFRGDGGYAPSEASAELTVSGSSQLYTQEVIPSVPGINASPIGSFGTASNTRWLLTGWPIAGVLIVVWSSYASAVFFMSRIAAATGEGPDLAEAAAGGGSQEAGR
jgi:hypothetical protein